MLFFISINSLTFSQQRKLTAGPMPGDVTANTSKIWLLVKKTKTVCIFLTENNAAQNKKSITISTDTVKAYKKLFPITVDFNNLSPDTEYEVTLLLDKKTIKKKIKFKTLKKTASADFSFLTGSCALQLPAICKPFLHAGTDKIFKKMQTVPSDFMIWLGDNTYYIKKPLGPPDFASAKGMWRRQIKSRKIKRMNNFLTSRPQYAIWDDHDYGSYDGDESFPLKDTSLYIYRSLWANPSYGLPGVNGIFSSFRKYDSEFFLLDDRFYRNAPNTKNGTMLGKEQLSWFLAGLKKSDAVFKFIVLGSPMLNPNCKDECYSQFPEEKKAIFDFIKNNNITGIIFLTGDSHHSDLQKQVRENTYPFYDFTCSPISSFPSKPTPNDAASTARVPNTLTVLCNFGRVSVTGAVGSRICTIELFNDKAKLLWKHEIPEKELR